jgi:hypothetical protein
MPQMIAGLAGTLLFCWLCIGKVSPVFAFGQEVSLYASEGEAVAYIAVNDEMTIYLWDGEPAAYLERGFGAFNDAFNVYGFNGEHLGWFERGAIWMHDGNAACALKEALTVLPHLEPLKSLKLNRPGFAGGSNS